MNAQNSRSWSNNQVTLKWATIIDPSSIHFTVKCRDVWYPRIWIIDEENNVITSGMVTIDLNIIMEFL